ncbi:MAG: murein hydrolase activator EnvC family protein [Dissulfurimicrobium sp.]|uniref:murein hydrolase activator EnvC family protein n=1 Tax=Dissulfurimicrobium sp. TaxID=2022436 RepID=UPI00404AD39E
MRHRVSTLPSFIQALNIALILAAIVFIIMPFNSQANDRSYRHNADMNDPQNPYSDLQAVKRNLSKEIKKIREIDRRRQSVLNEIHDLDEKIIRQWEAIDALKKKRTEIELRLLDAEKEYSVQLHTLQDINRHIEIRLAAISRIGTVGILNILFSASTIPEMISRENYLKLILENDHKIRNDYLARLKRLRQAKKDMENEKEALEKISKDIEAQTLLFESKKQEKQAYLAKIKSQAENHNAILEELKNAAKSLQSVVTELDQKESAFNGRITPEKGEAAANSFAAQKGRLLPPVEGRIAKKNGIGGPMPGIIIQAPFGSEIRAVFDGKIMYCDTLPGYGKVLIIDHGDNYYSLTAQGAKFFKSTGDKVMEGDIIGISGSGPLVSEGIYFELRHGKAQKDPLKWLDIKN